MNKGWVKAWRSLYDPGHPLAPNKRDPASRRDAWMDLVQQAQHSDFGGLKRGEIRVSVRYLARRWGWSKSRIGRFILWLANATTNGTPKEPMLQHVSGTQEGSVYLVGNYDSYSDPLKAEWDTEKDPLQLSSGTPSGTPAGHLRDKNKNVEGRTPYPTPFEEWWKAYPKRSDQGSKKNALASWKRSIKLISKEELLRRTKIFCDEQKRNGNLGTAYVPMPATWLNGARWEQWKEKPEVPEPTPDQRLTRETIW